METDPHSVTPMQFHSHLLQRCWFLAGPTASGKTAVGLELAGRLNAEIISLDSMSLYRGMDIGTAKPSEADRERIGHHLIDLLDPHEEFSVAEYLQAAQTACREILDRGRTPLFVGGTGLYLRSILRGVFEGPAADWQFRRDLKNLASRHGTDYLHSRLHAVDPVAATALHPHDTRRLIRALEVFELTGVPLSQQQLQGPLPPQQRPAHVYWLLPPRGWLYEQIDARVEAMFAAGLVAEVARLLQLSPPMSRTARQALGYKEVIAHLEGHAPLAETMQHIQQQTRRFAKRQHTWFRGLEECKPIEITAAEPASSIAERILASVADEMGPK